MKRGLFKPETRLIRRIKKITSPYLQELGVLLVQEDKSLSFVGPGGGPCLAARRAGSQVSGPGRALSPLGAGLRLLGLAHSRGQQPGFYTAGPQGGIKPSSRLPPSPRWVFPSLVFPSLSSRVTLSSVTPERSC